MRKGLFYICLLLVGVGLFAGCKSKKAVVASFSDLDGEWGVVEMNGKTLNPEETHQVLVFDVARQGLSGNAGCNRLMGKIEYNDAYKNKTLTFCIGKHAAIVGVLQLHLLHVGRL